MNTGLIIIIVLGVIYTIGICSIIYSIFFENNTISKNTKKPIIQKVKKTDTIISDTSIFEEDITVIFNED